MKLQSVNPATGGLIAEYERHTEVDIEAAILAADKAFRAGRSDTPTRRADLLTKTAGILETRKEELAGLMTREMGKPITQARAEIEKCALVCRYYADNGEAFLADEMIESGKGRSFVRHLPLGPILAVMPWNYPFWQVFRFAAPNLMAGNTALLKHASNVTGCALAIEDVFREAGYPAGSFTTLKAGSDQVAGVLKDPRVRGATLTGSEKAGSALAGTAGGQVKKTVLELGGSDAFIVMPSADIGAAVDAGLASRLKNNGQSCIAAKRFFLHADIHDDFRERFLTGLSETVIGDPMDDATGLGPLVSRDACEMLHNQVSRTVSLGGRRIGAGQSLPETGAFFEPAILEDIPAASPAATEELFGPVAIFYPVRSLTEAIDHANDHRYGLGSSVWTTDESETEIAINRIEAGSTYINQMVSSDPKLPFGGVKKSGYGRELSMDGIREFTNRKTVAIK
ncbi:NAD-dependent succinate-semialdehyde dehydrogenase [Hyphobacterium marinum]|uniref:NAD-dependent succinate-semialdehyde dehydrogenase n=1 Tax=Hyphobacterium marinum TaxID=3116574 RepID=A0ABU7LXJ0_9PROT|nr:NAD-dependent succinate-semialdehyde dehydrogenase [Hyphobacterium sp. Y6023]MEE2565997.1 NAD-dependent succinate-semialdehyde dehydrogenase [Hyphobacterium sp. Y6023]